MALSSDWDGTLPVDEKPFLFSSEPITGYRTFRWGSCEDHGMLFDLCAIAPEGENPFAWARKPRLMSAAYGIVWPERRPMHATCLSDSSQHPVAARRCSCGLWAVKTKERALSLSRQYSATIVAEVSLWGHFIEHVDGWRAEYGYPQKVWVVQPYRQQPGSWKDADFLEQARIIGEQYGIPADVWKQPPPKPKPKPTTKRLTATWQVSTSANTGLMVTPIPKPAAPAPATPWPSTIVHPSELYSTIVVPRATTIYVADLPF